MSEKKNEDKMSNSNIELLNELEKIHTTDLGIDRIKRNLNIENDDVVEYCKNIILSKDSKIYKQGKNWYCIKGDKIITINSYSYTIITAHKLKQ